MTKDSEMDPTLDPKLERELRYRIHCLGDPVVNAEDKLAALQAILEGGKAAMPLLIERLATPEDAMFLERTLVDTGPMNPGPPVVTAVSVKYIVEATLYRLVYPDQVPMPEMRGEVAPRAPVEPSVPSSGGDEVDPDQALADWAAERDAFGAGLNPDHGRPPLSFVPDWSAFWKAHQHESLEQMRVWARAELDRRWADIVERSSSPPPATPDKAASLPARGGAASRPRAAMAPAAVPTGALSGAELSGAQKAYERARKLYQDALQKPAQRPLAIKALTELAKSNPALRVHTDYMRWRLQ